jgi:hypothetical protein
LGKGRQRESTYINENVVFLQDILQLRRRSAGSAASASEEKNAPKQLQNTISPSPSTSEALNYVDSDVPFPSGAAARHRTKRRRLNEQPTTTPTIFARSVSPSDNLVSEDELSEGKQYIALDLTKPRADDEVLAGCSALLELATHGWS